MGKVTFKNPGTVLKFTDGRAEINESNLTDEVYDNLVAGNARFKRVFNDPRETEKPVEKRKKEEATA